MAQSVHGHISRRAFLQLVACAPFLRFNPQSYEIGFEVAGLTFDDGGAWFGATPGAGLWGFTRTPPAARVVNINAIEIRSFKALSWLERLLGGNQ